jgi:hypothetical protein
MTPLNGIIATAVILLLVGILAWLGYEDNV